MIDEKFNNFNGLMESFDHDVSIVEVFTLNHLNAAYNSEGWKNPIHYFDIKDDSPIMNIPKNINKETKEDLISFLENTCKPALDDMANDGRFDFSWIQNQKLKIKNILIDLK